MKKVVSLLALVTLTGCSTLVPKQVELFQDKVQPFPEQSAKLRELERQAVYRVLDKSGETVEAAKAEQASTNVIVPATEVRELSEAVAFSLGPPESPSTVPSEQLAVKLESAVAKYDTKIEKFKHANNENVGKKIEGTGLIQVAYVWWIGGIVGGLALLFVIGKLVLTVLAAANPGAALGLNAVNVAQSIVTKGFSQLIKGGEDFKSWVEKEVTDAGLKQKILDAFQASHMKTQDSDVQNVVQAMTK